MDRRFKEERCGVPEDFQGNIKSEGDSGTFTGFSYVLGGFRKFSGVFYEVSKGFKTDFGRVTGLFSGIRCVIRSPRGFSESQDNVDDFQEVMETLQERSRGFRRVSYPLHESKGILGYFGVFAEI